MATKIGGDGGHGWGKFYDGSRKVKFESVLGEVKGSLMGSRHSQIKTSEGHWLVGRSARKQSGNKMSGADESWAMGAPYRALILYGVAQFVPEDQKQVTVDLGSTLAVRDYKRNRAEIEESLLGEHLVEVDARRELKIIIKTIRFMPQGLAPASPYIDDHSYVVTTDLGTRNINHLTFDGREVIFSKTDSAEDGAIKLLDSLRQRIADKYGIEYHPIDLIERDIVSTGVISVDGKPINIGAMIAEEKEFYFETYRSMLSRLYGNAKRIDNLVVFGGGDYLIGDMIAKTYSQAVRLPDPQWAQVKSIYEYIAR